MEFHQKRVTGRFRDWFFTKNAKIPVFYVRIDLFSLKSSKISVKNATGVRMLILAEKFLPGDVWKALFQREKRERCQVAEKRVKTRRVTFEISCFLFY